MNWKVPVLQLGLRLEILSSLSNIMMLFSFLHCEGRHNYYQVSASSLQPKYQLLQAQLAPLAGLRRSVEMMDLDFVSAVLDPSDPTCIAKIPSGTKLDISTKLGMVGAKDKHSVYVPCDRLFDMQAKSMDMFSNSCMAVIDSRHCQLQSG